MLGARSAIVAEVALRMFQIIADLRCPSNREGKPQFNRLTNYHHPFIVASNNTNPTLLELPKQKRKVKKNPHHSAFDCGFFGRKVFFGIFCVESRADVMEPTLSELTDVTLLTLKCWAKLNMLRVSATYLNFLNLLKLPELV